MSNELGTLVVVVLKARNLNDKHSFYKQDVFAQVSLNGNTKRTKVDVKGGQHPIWDEEIRFPVMKDTAAKFRKLEVACFAKEHRSDDILGRGIVDLTDTLRTGEFDEWISLNVDGVVRGDLYLEITYFANAPAPAKHGNLSVPTNSTLARRPSKLSPSDRLYRPYQASAPPSQSSHSDARYQVQGNVSNALASAGTHLLPPSPSSSRSSSVESSRRSESPLPPLPEQRLPPVPLPTALVHGGGGAKPWLQDDRPPQVPSILRPGNNQISHTSIPNHGKSPTRHAPGPPRDDYYARPSSPNSLYSATTPHSRGYQTITVPDVTVPQFRPVLSTPQVWTTDQASAAPLLFPVPTVAQVQENVNYQTSTHAPELETSNYHQHPELPDPYLQARYQTPLPLPSGSRSPPRGPQPLPRESTPDPSRLEALRRAEEEAARRKQQEDKDLELALQLDRELNLMDHPPGKPTSATSANTPMPGGW